MLLPFLALGAAAITRDAYGVPHIQAPSAAAAFYYQGYTVAEDRMVQLEMSRRVARGRMAEITGPGDVAADTETLRQGYFESELRAQFLKLSPGGQAAFVAYTKGVNAYLRLHPSGGIAPWTVLDSVAVSIALFQKFGRGGAGELRNLALIEYLRSRPATKDRVLDVLDDFAPLDAQGSPATLSGGMAPWSLPSREASEKHLASLPRYSLLELLPAIRLASREVSTKLAERVGAPFQTGSYAMVVAPGRSATGSSLLLSAPQMGFRNPSVVHEVAIDAPGLHVGGIDVPGVPGVVIGHTPRLAWGLTSGIADTDDILLAPPSSVAVTLTALSVAVKGSGARPVSVDRALGRPVLLTTRNGTRFIRRSSYWMRELESWDALSSLWRAQDLHAADAAMSRATMSFNFFAATPSSILYRYVGLVPRRSSQFDPRLPLLLSEALSPRGRGLGEGATEGDSMLLVTGFGLTPALSRGRGGPENLDSREMPHAFDPVGGLLTNWNNRPNEAWPNGDTPAFMRLHDVSAIRAALPNRKLTVSDLEAATRTIAEVDPFWPAFAPYIRQALPDLPPDVRRQVAPFDGRMRDGAVAAGIYVRFLDELRRSLFVPITGNFLSPDYLRIVAQPSVILNALEGRTKVDYRQGRSVRAIVVAALIRAATGRPYAAETIKPSTPPIPYANRGTFIQIVEFTRDGVRAKSVLPPGNAASGRHAADQVSLTRAWRYKPMVPLRPSP